MMHAPLLRGLAAGVAALNIAAAPAATLSGVPLASSITVDSQTLFLSSRGVRETLWIDHYVAALYLPPSSSPMAAKDRRQPKAVRLHVVDTRFMPADIPDKWQRALARELPSEPMRRVSGAYRRLSNGDVLTFAYAPSFGVAMLVNDREVLRVPGHAVIDSILDAWAEELPVSEKLRRTMLEDAC